MTEQCMYPYLAPLLDLCSNVCAEKETRQITTPKCSNAANATHKRKLDHAHTANMTSATDASANSKFKCMRTGAAAACVDVCVCVRCVYTSAHNDIVTHARVDGSSLMSNLSQE